VTTQQTSNVIYLAYLIKVRFRSFFREKIHTDVIKIIWRNNAEKIGPLEAKLFHLPKPNPPAYLMVVLISSVFPLVFIDKYLWPL
jgi:hypothetical protein